MGKDNKPQPFLISSEESGADYRNSWEFKPMGILRTCFAEKFGIPRQPGLCPSAEGILTLLPPFDQPEVVRELSGFSHVWLLFVFHALAHREFKPTVRPPRLGGQRRIGVLASRSGYRPNPIGMSVVELKTIQLRRGRPELHVGGVDILDGTPVLDVKPYLPYSDNIPQARGGFAAHPPDPLEVAFTPGAKENLAHQDALAPEKFKQLIREVLSQDPRPAYQRHPGSGRTFGMTLWNFNVRWQVTENKIQVLSVTPSE
jgi:tRNA-Thr(GGU) m(6)t(6)A37 methyltransferase TsaA